MLSPEGRVVMISGANRGIGRAIARCLHDRGYSLSLGARDLDALAAAAEWNDERVATHRYDALDPANNADWVEATAKRFGRIDGLVNNAGIARRARVEHYKEAVLDELWAVNVKAPLRMIRLALPHLRASGAGRIVNVASLSGKRVPSPDAGYPMSKFAVIALTHATRQTAFADGVRVTALCPGYVATDMTATADFPREQMSDPADLAELVATVIALPNTASVPELLVNCRLEDTV